MIGQHAPVNPISLVHHQIADRNVLRVVNVINKQLASIKNAEIHVMERADLALNVGLLITIRFVAVQRT